MGQLRPRKESALFVLSGRVTGACVKYSMDELWIVDEARFEPEKQHHRETIFTIGNGYLSTRGALEVMSLVREFTEMRDRRAQLEESLRQSEERFRATFEQVAVGVGVGVPPPLQIDDGVMVTV